MQSLRKQLNLSYSAIQKSLYKRDASAWLTDNFYIIDKFYRQANGSKTALSQVDFYYLLKRYCAERDCLATPKTLKAFLSLSEESFSYTELCSMSTLLSVCAITCISEALCDEKSEYLIPNAIKLLRTLDDPEYEDILPELWEPEAVIANFEEDYSRFDRETKARYRHLLALYAKQNRISETEAAITLTERARLDNRPLGSYLFEPQKRHTFLWIAVFSAIFAILCAISLYSVGWLTLILTVPYCVAAGAAADQIVSRFVPAFRAPRLLLESIPDNAKTLVAVAVLLNGKDDEAFESLARFRYMNTDDNIYYCLLADLPDCDSQYRVDDNAIISNARERIDKLNRLHGEHFCLFLRERVMNRSEGRYGGWERKRGAVCELISHIVHGGKSEYYGGDFIRDIKYLLTLDSDTDLSLSGVNELVSIALHPVNIPRIENGKVVSGYGIIQPSVHTSLKSGYKTAFSRLISGAGGADPYANAEFSRRQALFGSGSFCGKGLINVTLFNETVNGVLPEGLVLSHDIIEGSIMRTLAATDIAFTDSTPANTVSFFRRQHRWMRGDFQNLYFLFGSTLNLFSKWRIFLIALRHLSPACSLIAILLSAFSRGFALSLFLLAYSEYLLPYALSLIYFFFGDAPFASLRFFSKAYSMLVQALARTAFEISSGARRGLLALHALLLACIRICSRKKTLEWTTAAQTEKLSSSLGKYVLDGAFSAAIGLALLIFAYPPFVRLAGLLYFVYPLISLILSRPLGGGTEVSANLTEKQKKMLSAQASDMLNFYLENVNSTTNHLPPDNIQMSPVYDTAYRTSPTNIGFYLVSLLAARDNRDIDTKTLCARLYESIEVIKRLKKYNGNLYNWYDIKTLSVIGGDYVSAVDSGNFLVMLVALKEGLREYADENDQAEALANEIEAIIRETDLSCFYDERKNLFCIGINGENGEKDKSCYDMLMSEARMTAYYAVAKHTVTKKHWSSLNRTLTHSKGYIGMMSWSGTAFEYLMPQLFLPLYRDSFIYESVAFSLMVQRAECEPWGISESGYYSFDSEMHYRYKANGVQKLALRRTTADEKTVSPYSTYLSLCILGNCAIKNLKAFENRGMYGRYGLYEALDLNRDSGGICVKSYMAHHVGMSIIAVMNAVYGNIFVRRFMSDLSMASANGLLQEKIPTDAHIFEKNHTKEPREAHIPTAKGVRTENASLISPSAALLRRGNFSAVITGSGHIGLNFGEKMLVHTEYSPFSMRFSPSVVFSAGSRCFGCAPLYGEGSYSFERGNGCASHIVSNKEFSGRVRYCFAKNCDCFIVSTRAESNKKYSVTLAFEPILESAKKYLSHISFSRLFIESEYDKQKRILYFHRRSGLDGRHIFTLAVAPHDKDTNITFLTSRERFKASSIIDVFDYAKEETDNKTGACIDPFCLMRAENAEGGRAVFLIACGETKSECEKNIRLARTEKSEYAFSEQSEMLDKMLPALLYRASSKKVESLSKFSINDLWAHGISGDHPIALVHISETAVSRTDAILNAYTALVRAYIRCELIFLVLDTDGYNRPVEKALRERCTVNGVNQHLGANGGIFILREKDLNSEFIDALKRKADFYYDLAVMPKKRNEPHRAVEETIARPAITQSLTVPDGALKSNRGFFTENGFTTEKSVLPDAPYSFVLAGKRFATVVTQSSLGYTFYDNARERRLCSFYGDARTLDNGERIFAIINGKRYDLCAIAQTVRFEAGSAVYCGSAEGNYYTLTVTVHPRFPIKLMRAEFTAEAEVRFCIDPVMGGDVAPRGGIEIMQTRLSGNGCLIFKNSFGITFPEGCGFAGACNGNADAESKCLTRTGTVSLFFIGACTNENAAKNIAARVNDAFFENSLSEAMVFANSFIPKINIATKSKTQNLMFNFFLPYQVAACRFFARASFYQSGGAYGFRDQLQDCLTLIYSMPHTVRTHIIRCCAHQYLDGSVMHWWHTRVQNGVNSGIKSKCSDDLLYLPIVIADYIQKTGDTELLNTEVHYLTSPPLGKHNERYELPARSDTKESIYRHCLRALSCAERVGKNGLILMGSCDWNDAFSLVGAKGIGESVFSTMLFILAATAFLPFVDSHGDAETAQHYRESIERFKQNIEQNAFFGDRYARAFCDDGTILGIEGCGECEIDILSQAFAALAGLNPERTKIALNTAFSKLYDRKNKIFSLFSPPFANGNAHVGYIRGYVAGIRENGGQYTHGALWGALGFLKCGMTEEALLILDCVNPAARSADKELARNYKIEPYAVAADIYGGANAGRGGWSWYTGSASWYYRIMLENILGLRLGANQTLLSATPVIPFECDITLGNAVVHITAARENKSAFIDGAPAAFPLSLSEGRHTLLLPVKG